MSAIFLEDRDQHPRVRPLRADRELVEPARRAMARVETEGESRTERLLWAVMLGDLVSLQLAASAGSTRSRSSRSTGSRTRWE